MKNRRHEPSANIPLELGEFLCFAVYSAGHAFNRVYQPLLRDLDLTYPQFIAMILCGDRTVKRSANSAKSYFCNPIP